jgi:hypothetical protein
VQDDDGTFFIEFREYAAAINTIYVCKVGALTRARSLPSLRL